MTYSLAEQARQLQIAHMRSHDARSQMLRHAANDTELRLGFRYNQSWALALLLAGGCHMKTVDQISSDKLRGGFYSPAQLVRTCLDRIEALSDIRTSLRIIEPS